MGAIIFNRQELRSRLNSALAYLETLDPAEAGLRKLRAPTWQLHVVIFTFAFFLLVSRRPDFLFSAQFCQEDGRTWYMDAYRLGWGAFLIPCNGSLILFPRIAAAAIQHLPLLIAPTIFNLISAFFHVLLVSFLFTPRMREALPRPWMRCVLALAIIGVPGSGEVLANLSNVHNCHLALLAAMVLLMAKPSRFLGWRIFDVLVVLVSGLSGPYCVALLPLGLIRWAFYTRTEASRENGAADRRWLLLLCGLTALCAVIQTATLFHFAPIISARMAQVDYPNAVNMARHRGRTGASFPLFIDLIGGKVIFAALLGDNRWYEFVNKGDGVIHPLQISLPFAILGGSALVRSLRLNSPSRLRVPLFVVFTWYIFFATLAYPLNAPYLSWTLWLFAPIAGNRYWFIPMIGFFSALVTVAAFDSKAIYRRIAILLLLLAPIGMVGEWAFTPWPDLGFERAAIAYEKAAPGVSVRIPEFDRSSDFVITKR